MPRLGRNIDRPRNDLLVFKSQISRCAIDRPHAAPIVETPIAQLMPSFGVRSREILDLYPFSAAIGPEGVTPLVPRNLNAILCFPVCE